MNYKNIKEEIFLLVKNLGGSDIKFLNQILTLVKIYAKEKRGD